MVMISIDTWFREGGITLYSEYRKINHQLYNNAKNHFTNHPEEMIEIEKQVTQIIFDTVNSNITEISRDYNEASYLNPFWASYPPEDRGRAPIGDQVPWIEVGEHAVGHKISRLLSSNYNIREIGLPSGADDRFILQNTALSSSNSITDRVLLFLDIKSVGPRDDQEHAVLSPYQVSGDGIWTSPEKNLENSPMAAVGQRATHPFYPALSPIYILSDGTIAPTM